MIMRMKTLMTVMMTAMALMTAALAHADPNPANDSGVFTVRLAPNVDLGVTVDTSGANWSGSGNLDVTMVLGTDSLLQSPVLVTMTGNFRNQELALTGTALNTWTLDTDEVDRTDQLRLYAMFGIDPLSVGTPALGEFAGAANLIKTVQTRVGQPQADEAGDTNHVYELPWAANEYVDMDQMLPSDTRSLWLRASTPGTSTTDMQAAFVVTVTAVTGVGL